MKKSTSIAGLGLVVALSAGGYYGASPYLAASHMRDAAERGDVAAIAEGVDLVSLRSSVSVELSTMAAGAVGPEHPVLGGVFAKVTDIVTRELVERLVTPEVVLTLVRGELPGWAGAADGKASGVDVRAGYDDLDHFRARFVERGGAERFSLIFERRGLTRWVLVALNLPK